MWRCRTTVHRSIDVYFRCQGNARKSSGSPFAHPRPLILPALMSSVQRRSCSPSWRSAWCALRRLPGARGSPSRSPRTAPAVCGDKRQPWKVGLVSKHQPCCCMKCGSEFGNDVVPRRHALAVPRRTRINGITKERSGTCPRGTPLEYARPHLGVQGRASPSKPKWVVAKRTCPRGMSLGCAFAYGDLYPLKPRTGM